MAYKIYIHGIVQGVGFRPFVYNLAVKSKIKGYISNTSKGVEIYLNETKEISESFLNNILHNLPPLAYVVDYKIIESDESIQVNNFFIKHSKTTPGVTIVSPDTAICNDCKDELQNKNHHKFLYPFINCTNCGPRYSIIKTIPYDRINTSMNIFKMCKTCQAEYDNPLDRRFHAQPNACNSCGPHIYFNNITKNHLLTKAYTYLNEGKIIGVKGIGGYHIICDALNIESVSKLRNFKKRNYKPFAIMVKDIKTLKKYDISLTKEEEKLFDSQIAPIVIKDVNSNMFKHINPLGKNIGFMKAYAPIHLLLFNGFKGDFLIATSGNQKDEPIAINDIVAEKRLTVCELFIHNNREIINRVDDSIVRVVQNKPYILRRGRGYAPLPVIIKNKQKIEVVGLGANLKSSICFLKENYAFVSQYIGDLENFETQNFYTEVYNRLKTLFKTKPTVAITDLHPKFFTTKFSTTLGIKTFAVQHHIAHFYANMAENNITDNAIGVVLDGTGLGANNCIWGGELFVKSGKLSRETHLEYTPLVGGESAIKYPYRMFLSYLAHFNISDAFLPKKHKAELALIKQMISTKFNVVETSSMGRLFEAIGAFLLNIEKNEFEAHAAMALEGICVNNINDYYEFEIDDCIRIKKILTAIIQDVLNKIDTSLIATKFHNTIAQIILTLCILQRNKDNINNVCLSGGVFQNIFLLNKVISLLESNKFNVYLHKNIPANDACISLGQVYYYLLESNSFK